MQPWKEFFMGGGEGGRFEELFCVAETGAKRWRDAIWRRARARCPSSAPFVWRRSARGGNERVRCHGRRGRDGGAAEAGSAVKVTRRFNAATWDKTCREFGQSPCCSTGWHGTKKGYGLAF